MGYGKEAMLKFKYRRCPPRAFTMMHPPPRSYGGSQYRHPFWQSANPPPLNYEGKETSNGKLLEKSKMGESPCCPHLRVTTAKSVNKKRSEESAIKEMKLNGGTSFKINLTQLYNNAMEVQWGNVRNHAWTMWHPPPG